MFFSKECLVRYLSNRETTIQPDQSVAEYAKHLGFSTFDHQFNKFKLDHNKNYVSHEEEEQRKFNFLKSLQFIEKHNELYRKGEVTHEVGISLFADLAKEEYDQIFSMSSPFNKTQVIDKFDGISNYAIVDPKHLPSNFDWSSRNMVTPIKNQGSCGASWAFTTNALIESYYALKYNQWLSLSEQQLIDCMEDNVKCHSGFYIDKALHYAQVHGVSITVDYPYKAHPSSCSYDAGRFNAKITGFKTFVPEPGYETVTDSSIASFIAHMGPLGVMLDASGDDFIHYKGGVLSTGSNGWKNIHAVTLVGYNSGQIEGQDYWIFKNSWGTGWGEAGYFKMAAGKNLRGMNEYLYYPTF